MTRPLRLTRLLDDLLDLSVLENGNVTLNITEGRLSDLLDRAVAGLRRRGGAGDPPGPGLRGGAGEHRSRPAGAGLHQPHLERGKVLCRRPARAQDRGPLHRRRTVVDFIDNGEGIRDADREVIFEKFSRLTDPGKAGGAGLGLAICREIMERLGGAISYQPGQGGAAFRVTLPATEALAAE